MATFYFQRKDGVIDPPLSYIGYDGNLSEVDLIFLNLLLLEYNVIAGDISEETNRRESKLKLLRDEIVDRGHVVEVTE